MSWLSLAYLKCAQSIISKKHWQHSALNQLFTLVTACLTAVLTAAAQHQERVLHCILAPEKIHGHRFCTIAKSKT